ncbi:recombinase family protein [Pseudonocardia sp. CA-107938]|uniref:recombinase family protein n=1 Tax=Pseudonocardia sp. CA-107938 TaxID=3240021 RepID=UPI003D930508
MALPYPLPVPGGGPALDIYARLSRAVNGELIKVTDQIELCADQILERGGQVGEVFMDNSLSAWNPRVVRPQWNTLMDRIESGATDGVMVYDARRFTRKIIEGERLIDAAERGVRVWSYGGEYRLTTADGRAAFREDMVKAAAESDKTSERVKFGKRRKARRGRVKGGHRSFAMPGWLPVGPEWEPGDDRERVPAEQVEAERAVARECIERLLAGESTRSLVAELNLRVRAGELGCATTTGGEWTVLTLSRTLQRPAMAGILTFVDSDGEEKSVPLAGVDPVVPQQQWEELCALFAARRHGRPPTPTYLLTGVMVCERCGSPMRGHPRKGLAPYPDGSMRREYRCRRNTATDLACGRNGIDMRLADEVVRSAVLARLGDPKHAGRMAARTAAVSERRARLEAEIARWDDEASALSQKTLTWGVARVDRQMAPILAKITALRAELEALDEEDTPRAARANVVAAWTGAERDGDVATLRALVRYAFPNLALACPARRGDSSTARFLWNGREAAAAA